MCLLRCDFCKSVYLVVCMPCPPTIELDVYYKSSWTHLRYPDVLLLSATGWLPLIAMHVRPCICLSVCLYLTFLHPIPGLIGDNVLHGLMELASYLPSAIVLFSKQTGLDPSVAPLPSLSPADL